MLLGPIPCKSRISFLLWAESFSKLIIPSFSKALLAGALNLDKNPLLGFSSASQIGQTGHSLVL
jgi:hypothetical protein